MTRLRMTHVKFPTIPRKSPPSQKMRQRALPVHCNVKTHDIDQMRNSFLFLATNRKRVEVADAYTPAPTRTRLNSKQIDPLHSRQISYPSHFCKNSMESQQ